MQSDRQDKSAVGWDHQEKVEDHQSQKDHKIGFGGQYGVLSDRQDKSAVGWDHVEKVEKHQSQKGKGCCFIRTENFSYSDSSYSYNCLH